MEAQDTVMEARGTSNVNTVDTAASQPRYSLRSTDKVNRRESSVTKVDPHHCATDETEKQHSSPPPPHSLDLTPVLYQRGTGVVCFSFFFWLRVLDKAEYSAFESTLKLSLSYRIVSYRIVDIYTLCLKKAQIETV